MEPLHQLFSNTLFYKRTWIRKNIPSAAHWLRGWIFSIQLKPRYEVSRTDTPELEIMYPPDERAEVAAAESQSPLQARLILVWLGFYYIQSIDLFNLQWFTHCMMWNDVQWNLTHRVTERINIFVVYLYIWFRHTARTPAWSGLRCRGSWFFSFSVGSWTTLFLSPCIWHYIFLSASQLLVLLGNWCFLLSIKKCQWEKGYSTQGQKCSWTHLQTFTNILIRYFVNSLSLTFSKDLICVVWEGFMVPVRWLSWLCGSWSYVRVRRLKTKNDNRGGPYLFRGTESTHCLMMTYGDWCAFDGNQSTEYHVSQKQSDHFDVLLPMLGTWLRLMLPSKKKRSGTTENMVYK